MMSGRAQTLMSVIAQIKCGSWREYTRSLDELADSMTEAECRQVVTILSGDIADAQIAVSHLTWRLNSGTVSRQPQLRVVNDD